MSETDTTPWFEPDDRESIRAALLTWFEGHQREMPWRGEDVSAYGTWVSEIMLQQTQVATVRSYYTRWMERFPTVRELASAELEEVLEMWSGLGYYRRAKLLHKGARYVVDELGGGLPETAAELLALPGVGRYTAGAIASIAFGEAAPLVDGNVERVFARWRAIDGDPKGKENQKAFWAIASELVDAHDPGEFNQSLMELGATVCTPKSPSCLLCPVRAHCAALAQGEPTKYPAKRARKAPKKVAVETCVVHTTIEDERAFLLVKRPDEGIWPGLLEPPSSSDGALDELLEQALGARPEYGEAIGSIEHRLSHRLMTFTVRDAHVAHAAPRDVRARWVRESDLDSAALSAASRKIIALVTSRS